MAWNRIIPQISFMALKALPLIQDALKLSLNASG
jgi:hypothetical protein